MASLVGYVHTVQLKLKIEDATSPFSDEPTPLYRMDEILAVVGRDKKNIDDAVDCMEQRLQLHSAATKQKTLKLIKYMSLKGSGELQRALVRLSQQIKELQAYRCAPDAFKGDIPWKRVQEYAKEALESVHAVKDERNRWNEEREGFVHAGGMGSSRKMEGFGSGGNEFSSERVSKSERYEGFGNGPKTRQGGSCLLYTSPSPRDVEESRMPFSA